MKKPAAKPPRPPDPELAKALAMPPGKRSRKANLHRKPADRNR